METPKEILAELQQIAPFLGKRGVLQIPYTLPTGYFTDFAEILMNRIRFEARSLGESVDTLAEISPNEEISGISPLLAGLKNKNPYKTPEGYFETLNPKIPAAEFKSDLFAVMPAGHSNASDSKVRPGQSGRVSIPMRILRYATAACIVGLISIAAYNVTVNRNFDPIKGLAAISDQDMANYLDADDIHWTPGVISATASVDFSDNDIHDLLSNVPDEELEQYSLALPEQKGTVN